MVNGAGTDALPVSVPLPLFVTVKFCVADDPTATDPNDAELGVTVIAGDPALAAVYV